MSRALPYGWSDFDPEVVAGLIEGHPEHMVKRREGGMTCPLVEHKREWLHWQDGNYAQGTEPHGSPEVSFRVSPTYILSDPRDNFIAGADLIAKILDGSSGKAETSRLGHENSEDALTWNVFRSMQEARLLHALTPLLCDCREPVEPALYLWGAPDRRERDRAVRAARRSAPGIRADASSADRTRRRAAVARLGLGVCRGQVRISGDNRAQRGEDGSLASPLRGQGAASHRSRQDRGRWATTNKFPEQLLRNAVFASWIAARTDENAHVVLLARKREITPVEDWLADCMARRRPSDGLAAHLGRDLRSPPGSGSPARDVAELHGGQELLAPTSVRSLAVFIPREPCYQRRSAGHLGPLVAGESPIGVTSTT